MRSQKSHQNRKRILGISLLVFLSLFGLVKPCWTVPNKTLKIGVVVPLSGSTATFGMDCLAGLNLAIEETNRQGGVKGYYLMLDVRDNQGDPYLSAQAVHSLAETEVIAIIGAVTSNNTLAAATVAQSQGIPLLTPYSSHEAVTEVGDYISRICFTDFHQARELASYAYSVLGLRKVAIIKQKGSRYSESLADYFQDNFIEMGGNIAIVNAFQSSEVDMSKSLTNIKREKPDAIFLPVYYSDAARIAKEIDRMNICKTLLGGDGWESAAFFSLVGDTLNDLNIYITSHFSAEDSRPAVQHFVKSFQNENGRKPNALVALAYDAGLLLVDAIARAPQINREVLKETLNSTNKFEGVTGTISMNEKRDPRKGVYILEAQNDGYHLRVDRMLSN